MTLRRKLGGPELAWGLSSGVGSANTLRVAKLRGPLTHAALVAAFAWLQKKHPLLQVRVENRHDELFFTSEHVGAVPVAWRVMSGDEDFSRLCEDEINTSLDWTVGPLVRVTGVEHLGDKGSHSVLIVFHHAINDSTSSTQLVTQMLSVLARNVAPRGSAETPLAEPETLPLLPPADRLLPDDFRSVSGVVRVAKFLARSLANEILMRPALLQLDRSRAANGPRSTHLLFSTLTQGSTQAIEEAARANGTTVQGALCAAMLIAGYRMAHSHLPAVNYRLFSFVNIRGLLEPQVHRESVGCYVSMVGAIHSVGIDSEFWSLARAAKKELDEAIVRGDALANVAIADRFVDFVAKRGRHTLAAMTVSNIGRLPFSRRHGEFELENLYAASAMNGIGACCGAIVSTLHGRLSWTFTYVKPYISQELAQRYFQLALETLCGACGTALMLEGEAEGVVEVSSSPKSANEENDAKSVRAGAQNSTGTRPSVEHPERRGQKRRVLRPESET